MTDSAANYHSQAKKKSVNLSINSELLAKAREQDINLSQTLENCLIELLKKRQGENWVRENESAISEYNKRIEKEGVFSDGLRTF